MTSSDPAEAHTTDRERMVEHQIAARGIRDEAVLDAMRRVPRHYFVPPEKVQDAYTDGALPVECGQTISQPYMVGRMTELLELRSEDTVLEVGTGTGYQTAILACVARHVFTIEWHAPLMNVAAERLNQLGLKNVSYRCGDGSLGWPEAGPFSAILVTAGAPDVPDPLIAQLADGGRMVVPVGPVSDQTLALVRRTGETIARQDLFKCRFVKLVGRAGWQE